MASATVFYVNHLFIISSRASVGSAPYTCAKIDGCAAIETKTHGKIDTASR